MQYLKNVATLKLNTDKCVGCGRCQEVCPHAVFKIADREANITDTNNCMECGACMKNCPASAIEVRPGVGCAYAIILGQLKGTEPTCGCDAENSTACC